GLAARDQHVLRLELARPLRLQPQPQLPPQRRQGVRTGDHAAVDRRPQRGAAEHEQGDVIAGRPVAEERLEHALAQLLGRGAGGGWPARAYRSSPLARSSSPYATVAIEACGISDAKRASRVITAPGPSPWSANARSALWSWPMTAAASSPRPTTSPTATPTRS